MRLLSRGVLVLTIGLVVTLPTVSFAQINIGGANSLTYTQSFDSLSNAANGTLIPFENNSNIVGLYAAQTNGTLNTYRPGNGGSNAGALYSFGATGDTDRALGSISSGTPQTLLYGFRFVNTSGTALSSFTVSYTGEQWRTGGGVTADQTLAFDYAINASTINDVSGYTEVAGLGFTVTDTGTATPAAGVTSPIRTATISQTVTANVGAGEEVWIRWRDVNDVGNDHGLGVDNLNVTFQPVPAPPAAISLGIGGLMGLIGTGANKLRARSAKRKPAAK